MICYEYKHCVDVVNKRAADNHQKKRRSLGRDVQWDLWGRGVGYGVTGVTGVCVCVHNGLPVEWEDYCIMLVF